MIEKRLYPECESCWCLASKRCDGLYVNVERIALPDGSFVESELHSGLDDERMPGDDECAERLVSVEDGIISLNNSCQYTIGRLSSFTKKDMANCMVDLMRKKWVSFFHLRVFVRRVFALKNWTPEIEIDVSPL